MLVPRERQPARLAQLGQLRADLENRPPDHLPAALPASGADHRGVLALEQREPPLVVQREEGDRRVGEDAPQPLLGLGQRRARLALAGAPGVRARDAAPGVPHRPVVHGEGQAPGGQLQRRGEGLAAERAAQVVRERALELGRRRPLLQEPAASRVAHHQQHGRRLRPDRPLAVHGTMEAVVVEQLAVGQIERARAGRRYRGLGARQRAQDIERGHDPGHPPVVGDHRDRLRALGRHHPGRRRCRAARLQHQRLRTEDVRDRDRRRLLVKPGAEIARAGDAGRAAGPAPRRLGDLGPLAPRAQQVGGGEEADQPAVAVDHRDAREAGGDDDLLERVEADLAAHAEEVTTHERPHRRARGPRSARSPRERASAAKAAATSASKSAAKRSHVRRHVPPTSAALAPLDPLPPLPGV